MSESSSSMSFANRRLPRPVCGGSSLTLSSVVVFQRRVPMFGAKRKRTEFLEKANFGRDHQQSHSG